MTAQQSAVLAMLDELRGLFATGALADARRLGGGVLAELGAAFAVTRMIPEAAIGGRPVVRDTGELAALCERAHARFAIDAGAAHACVRQLLQLAADLAERSGGSGPRAQHELRDDAGRTIAFADASPRGFQMIELPVPVLHPSARAAAATRLGITIDELRERDVDDIATQLPDLCVRSIPKIRPEATPMRYFMSRDRWAGPTMVEDPLAEGYRRLGEQIARHGRVVELGAPAEIVADAARSIQATVDDIADAAATPFEPHDAWASDCPPVGAIPYRGPKAAEYDGAPRIVWLTDDQIAITRNKSLAIVSLADGRVLRTLALGWGDRPMTCDASGRYLLVAGQFMTMLACIDTETGLWLDAVPDHVPAVSYHKNDVDGLDDSPNELFVFELRRNKVALFGGDWATPLAWSRGNTAVLISDNFDRIGTHGIRSTGTMLELVSFETLAARAVAAPVLAIPTFTGDVAAAMFDRGNRWDEPWPCAVAEVEGRWRVLLPSLHVGDIETTWFQLGFPIDAACWSPDGSRLAVFTDGAVQIIDIATRAITRVPSIR